MSLPSEAAAEIITAQSELGYTLRYQSLNPYEDTVLISQGGIGATRVYDGLLRDGRVLGTYRKRTKGTTARAWSVVPASDNDSQDTRAAEIVTAQLQAMEYDAVTRRSMGAIIRGLSIGEAMYREPRDARERARLGDIIMSEMRFKRPWYFRFDAERELQFVSTFNAMRGVDLSQFPRKFFTYTYGSEYDDPYGKGLGHQLYWPVYFKNKGWNSWLIFAEKFAMPTVDVEWPEGAKKDDPKVRQAMDAAKAIHTQSVIGHPPGFAYKMIEASRAGNLTNEALVDYSDKEIEIILLGSTLTVDLHGTGARAASETHATDSMDLFQDDGESVTARHNETLARWITEYNVPDATPPTIVRHFPDSTGTGERAKRDLLVMQAVKEGLDPEYAEKTYGVKIDRERLAKMLAAMEKAKQNGQDPNAQNGTEGDPDADDDTNETSGRPR